jgi:hypothetical protein
VDDDADGCAIALGLEEGDMKAPVWPVLVLSLLAAHLTPGMAQDTIRIRLANSYAAQIDIGIGKAERSQGADTLQGTLTRQPDGTWKGVVEAKISFNQEMKGILGSACPRQLFQGSQRLRMTGRTVGGFNATVQTISYKSGTAAEFLLLAIRPVAAAMMTSGDTTCLSMYQYADPTIPFPLLPLNDSRWLPEAGYPIGLPRSGVLEYRDETTNTTGGGNGLPLPVNAIGHWEVRVERP